MVGVFAEAGEEDFQVQGFAVFEQAEIGKLNGFGVLRVTRSSITVRVLFLRAGILSSISAIYKG